TLGGARRERADRCSRPQWRCRAVGSGAGGTRGSQAVRLELSDAGFQFGHLALGGLLVGMLRFDLDAESRDLLRGIVPRFLQGQLAFLHALFGRGGRGALEFGESVSAVELDAQLFRSRDGLLLDRLDRSK